MFKHHLVCTNWWALPILAQVPNGIHKYLASTNVQTCYEDNECILSNLERILLPLLRVHIAPTLQDYAKGPFLYINGSCFRVCEWMYLFFLPEGHFSWDFSVHVLCRVHL